MKSITRSIGWLLLLVLSTAIAGYAFNYFITYSSSTFDASDTGIFAHMRDRPLWFLMHVGGGGLALLIAPWQFASPIRNRWHKLHRVMGRIYVLAIAIGGAGGLVMAINSDAGQIAQLGFGLLAIGWLGSTAIAILQGWRRIIPSHRRWMIRSTAFTLAAVTLRLYMGVSFGILAPKFGISTDTAYVVISWLCWVPNILIAEWWIRRELGSERTPHPLPVAD